MIVFGVCVGSDERYSAFALQSVKRIADENTHVVEVRGARSIFAAYNEILDAAARVDGLEALVLLHEDVELRDPELLGRLKTLFADRSVGVVGVVGARDVRSLAWWEGERAGRVSWNGIPKGGGAQLDDFGFETCDVETIDGMFMALSPWVVANVRFDNERFSGFHGYDVDFCFEVRARERRVVVAPIDLHHHDRRTTFPDRLGWRRTDIRWRAKWGVIWAPSAPLRLALLSLSSKTASVRARARRARTA